MVGRLSEAIASYEQAQLLMVQCQDRVGLAVATANIGLVYHQQGNSVTALGELHTARELLAEIGHIPHLVGVLENIASVHMALGQWGQAHDHLRAALRHRIDLNDVPGEILVRQATVALYREQGQITEALQELQVVIQLEESIQHPDARQDQFLLIELEMLLTKQNAGATN